VPTWSLSYPEDVRVSARPSVCACCVPEPLHGYDVGGCGWRGIDMCRALLYCPVYASRVTPRGDIRVALHERLARVLFRVGGSSLSSRACELAWLCPCE